MKDNFSAQAADYAKFRPHYPPELFEYIFRNVQNFGTAWDCATGNGQVAVQLSKYFKRVEATDISENQLKNAFQQPNIYYQKAPAEKTPFADHSFDLITVGQALHWFKHDVFFEEVQRVAQPNAIFAAWCYAILMIDKKVDAVMDYLYRDLTEAFWDKERLLVEAYYNTIPFPFKNVTTKGFQYITYWSLEQFLGYLSTWSGVQHYIKKQGEHPVELIKNDMKKAWGKEEFKKVTFPIFLKMARI